MYLWHGNTFQALNKLPDLESAVFGSQDENAQKLLKGVEDLHTYIERNQAFIPNYGERYHQGERIAFGFVESAVNQVVSKRMVKRQQMGWTQRGGHLLLQMRTRVLKEEWEATFRRWYAGIQASGHRCKCDQLKKLLDPPELNALLNVLFLTYGVVAPSLYSHLHLAESGLLSVQL